MRLAILSNVNLDPLKPVLEAIDPDLDIYLAGFNQYVQEMMDPASGLMAVRPEVVVVHLEAEGLFGRAIFSPFTVRDAEDTASMEAESLLDLIRHVAGRLPGTLFLTNTLAFPGEGVLGSIEINSDLSLDGIATSYNQTLRAARLAQDKHLVLYNWDHAFRRWGENVLRDSRFWYLGRIPYSHQGLDVLARTILDTLAAAQGKAKKLIALDLDNTLWGGIIGEDGMEGIALGEDGVGRAYRDFQRYLKAMKSKGILLAVVSKNNLADALEVIEHHPMMVLRREDFVALKIDWRPKSVNLRELAEDLSLGVDSFVFIDDNPVERMEVRTELPMVEVPEFPDDAVYLPNWFLGINRRFFDKIALTDEDAQRSEMYRQEVGRKELEKSVASIEDFLEQLHMEAVIGVDTRVLVPRLAQLTQRTNQFNLTTRRYMENEVIGFMESGGAVIYDLELNDRFGSNGVVGLIIAKLDGATAIFDVFLMSCRIIGRQVEDAFVGWILRDLASRGIRSVTGEYVPTKKNGMTRGVFGRLGFSLVEIAPEGRETWTVNLPEDLGQMPKWVKITNRK